MRFGYRRQSLCCKAPTIYSVARKIDKNMGHPVLRARRDYKLSSLEELLSLIIINIIV